PNPLRLSRSFALPRRGKLGTLPGLQSIHFPAEATGVFCASIHSKMIFTSSPVLIRSDNPLGEGGSTLKSVILSVVVPVIFNLLSASGQTLTGMETDLVTPATVRSPVLSNTLGELLSLAASLRTNSFSR